MITEAILLILYTFLSGVLYLLPTTGDLPQGISDALDKVSPYIGLGNNFLPFDTLFTILGIWIGIQVALFSWKALNWAINKLRGSG